MRNYEKDSMRPVKMTLGFAKYAEGSCLIEVGDTHVLCTATIEERVPRFMKGTGKGWITAEYGMLPRCSPNRIDREAARGKQNGRTQEIQRLIGRSLRSVMDFEKLGERQIRIDCDVLRADGGTRTACITGSYVALHSAIQKLIDDGSIKHWPINEEVAAISAGIVNEEPHLDLNYEEDSTAQVDGNFVITSSGKIIEIQATGEERPYTQKELLNMLSIAKKGVKNLISIQREVLGIK
jgi:ribonuclease PH